MCTAKAGRSTARISRRYSSGPSGRLQPIISIENVVALGLTASMTVRQFSTVRSKNSCERFLGSGPYQTVGLNEPAMSTQHRAATASASASRSVTYARLAARFARSGSSMLRQAPTSAMTTSSAANASRMARIRSPSLDRRRRAIRGAVPQTPMLLGEGDRVVRLEEDGAAQADRTRRPAGTRGATANAPRNVRRLTCVPAMFTRAL